MLFNYFCVEDIGKYFFDLGVRKDAISQKIKALTIKGEKWTNCVKIRN